MTTVKKTITIDREVWEEFKCTKKRRYGEKMNLSKAVEEAISNYNTAGLLRDALRALNIEPGGLSSAEVEPTRPSAEGTSRLVRVMRDTASCKKG